MIDLRTSYQNSDIPRIEAGKLEAFFHEQKSDDGATKHILTVFKGKARKPLYNYYIPGSWDKRQRKWDEIKKSHLRETAEEQKEKTGVSELRKAWKNPYKIGDILYTSWGYGQTNVDFYQVVKMNPKSLVLRAIECSRENSSYMAGHKTPRKDAFCGDDFLARITFGRSISSTGCLNHFVVNKQVCRCGEFGSWDGKPLYYSSYH